jgi:ADP-ribose pyrophosphatase YjhB (NUDIX family)
MRRATKSKSREYPTQPVVGVGGVVISGDEALLIRRGSEPLKGQWSIPGGTLELGETLHEGVARELCEETGIRVNVLELIEVFERVFPGADGDSQKPRYHFVIVDYLCEAAGGELHAGSDVTDARFVREEDVDLYGIAENALRILRKGFAMARARAAR